MPARVGAVAVADQQRLGVEPENVAGFGGAGRDDLARVWELPKRKQYAPLMLAFEDAIRFAGTHDDQAKIGGERGVVSVDGVERKFRRGRKFEDLRAGRREFAAKCLMLRLALWRSRGHDESRVRASARRVPAGSIPRIEASTPARAGAVRPWSVR